jgi:drug/metabolite transporter (DMT)-like permease
MVGIYLVERKAGQGLIQPLGRLVLSGSRAYIFGALGLFAVSSVMDKMLVSSFSVDPVTVLFYQHIVYCAMFGALLLVRRASLRSVIAKGWGELLLIGIITILTISYRFTQLEATKLAPVALVLAVKRTSILYASFVGGKIFSEERLPTKLIGGTLIVAAGFLILRTVA